MQYNTNTIVSLDIGSSSIIAAMGKVEDDGRLQVLAAVREQSAGIRKGVVINIEEAIELILAALQQIEEITEKNIESLIVNIGGKHVEGINSRGVVRITGKNREVSEDDIRAVINTAQAVSVPMDKEIIHVIPRAYTVDQQSGLSNPLHVMGVRLEVDIHLMTASVIAGQNLIQCVNRAGFRVGNLAFGTYAAAMVVLMPEEKEQGVLLLNIGKETTEAVLFLDGSPVNSFVLVMGGEELTSDLAIMLKTTPEQAESIKHEFGVVHHSLILEPTEQVIVERNSAKALVSFEQQEICSILHSRMREILVSVKNKLRQKNVLTAMQSGIVITGGGAKVSGVAELAQEVFHTPARIGMPGNYGGKKSVYQDPQYSVAVGLLQYGIQSEHPVSKDTQEKRSTVVQNVKKWIRNFF